MKQNFPEFTKLELISHLSETFPEKADLILNKLENLCSLKDNNFEKSSDESKINFIIQVIPLEPDLLNEELNSIIQASLYLKKLDFVKNIKKLIEDEKNIKSYPFFNKSPVNPAQEKNIPEKLNLLREKIQNLLDNCLNLSLEIELNINYHHIFLKNLCFLQKTDECTKVINDLKLSIANFAKYEITLAEIQNNNLQRSAVIEKELSIYFSEKEKNKFSEEANLFIEEFNKVLKLQHELNNKILSIQMEPLENLLVLPELINSFSNILFSYPNINSFILSGESLKINQKSIETIKKLESQSLENFKTFLAGVNKLFNKSLSSFSPKDKKAIFKERFLMPIKNKFDNNAYLMVTKLSDILL